jgi:hypothetical protein
MLGMYLCGDVGGVVLTDFLREFEVCAKEGNARFGHGSSRIGWTSSTAPAWRRDVVFSQIGRFSQSFRFISMKTLSGRRTPRAVNTSSKVKSRFNTTRSSSRVRP